MRILCPVVEALVLPVLNAGHNLPLGGAIAAQVVGDRHTGRSQVLLEQFAEQALGGLLVATALHEDVENEPLLVDRAPEPMLLAGDGDDVVARRAGGSHPRALPGPCLTLSGHTAPDVRPL